MKLEKMIVLYNSICYYLLSLIIIDLHDDADDENYIIIIVKTLLVRGPITLFNNETYHYCDAQIIVLNNSITITMYDIMYDI